MMSLKQDDLAAPEAKPHIRRPTGVTIRGRPGMATANGRTNWLGRVAGSLLVRLVCYYAVLVGVMVLIWQYMPRSEVIAHESLDALFGVGAGAVVGGRRAR